MLLPAGRSGTIGQEPRLFVADASRRNSSVGLEFVLIRANLTFACAVKRRWSSVGRETHPGTGSLHPVAIGAVVEVTKLLKPLV